MAIPVRFQSGTDHQWLLKLGGSFAEGQDIFMVLKYLPKDYLLVAREKNNNFPLEKLDKTLAG